MPLTGFITRQDLAEERSLSLRVCQYKLPKLKNKERTKRLKNKQKDSEQNVQELWDNYKKCNLLYNQKPKGEEKKQKKYLKQS